MHPDRTSLGITLLVAWMAAACAKPAAPDSPMLGKWLRAVEVEYGKEHLEVSSNGSCRLASETRMLFCNWTSRPDGSIALRYGRLLPVNTATGKAEGNELTLDHGDYGSVWYRAGSPEDRNQAAYIQGRTLIQSGDSKNGMAQWKMAADQGHHGAQNSLAWLLATDKDSRWHDGRQAVLYAEKATARLHHYIYLDTLAAALARDSQFERAVEVEEEALSLLQKDSALPADAREAAVARFRHRIDLYRSGQAYTEP